MSPFYGVDVIFNLYFITGFVVVTSDNIVTDVASVTRLVCWLISPLSIFFRGGGIFCVTFVAYFSISGDDISEFQCFLWLWYCCLFQFYYLFLVCLIICCLLPQYGDISVWFIFFFTVISVLFKKLYFLLLEFLSMILMLFQPIITFLILNMKKCHWLWCLRLCIFCI